MNKYAVYILLIFIVGVIFANKLISRGFGAEDLSQDFGDPARVPNNLIMKGDYLLARNHIPLGQNFKEKAAIGKPKVIKAVITAYTSSKQETDNTPFITASGSYTRYGIAAANFLPIGTQIKLPNLFGDQIFLIEDRLNDRYNNRIDVWLPAKDSAKDFGVRYSEVDIF